jgi:Icc-related predicted phosphoesterase
MPEGDLLIHAGDFTSAGRPVHIKSFINWLKSLSYKHIIFIAGNHDITLCPDRCPSYEYRETARRELLSLSDHIYYLENTGTTIEGINIWGSPYTPEFCGWGFMKSDKMLSTIWKQIPTNTDILITHGPPAGILSRNIQGYECGSSSLCRHIKRIQPKLHIFGHIHEGQGQQVIGKTHYINASACTFDYQPTNAPIVIDI